MEFKSFLLTEQKKYFADKTSDILSSLHELLQSGDQIGERHLINYAENIVNQIRKIIHQTWPSSFRGKYLKKLQKCGVAIMKSIDEKGDLREVLNSCKAEIEKILKKLGEPVNALG